MLRHSTLNSGSIRVSFEFSLCLFLPSRSNLGLLWWSGGFHWLGGRGHWLRYAFQSLGRFGKMLNIAVSLLNSLIYLKSFRISFIVILNWLEILLEFFWGSDGGLCVRIYLCVCPKSFFQFQIKVSIDLVKALTHFMFISVSFNFQICFSISQKHPLIEEYFLSMEFYFEIFFSKKSRSNFDRWYFNFPHFFTHIFRP